MSKFTDLVSEISSILEEEDMPLETISLAIRIFAEYVKNTRDYNRDDSLICGLLATYFGNDLFTEIAYLFTEGMDVRNKELFKEIMNNMFIRTFNILLATNGSLYQPEKKDVAPLLNIDMNTSDLVKIGSGSYGIVYKFENYAVKAVEYDNFSLEFSNLIKELGIYKYLEQHQNIPLIHFISMNNETEIFYIGMNYIDYTFIQSFENLDIHDLLKQLSSALQYIHQKGIIHCDLKFDNIMIDRQNIAYIIDFGSAHFGPALELEANYIGTHPFRDYLLLKDQSIGKNKSQYSYEIDIWSMGIIFYTIITKSTPFIFGDVSYKEYAAIIEKDMDEVLDRVDDDFYKKLIEGMLSLNKENRWTTTQIVNYLG